MVSSSATIHKPRYSRERSAGFSWGTLLHFLGIALHALTPTSEAFAANACTSRRPIFSPIQHVTNDRLKNECLHPSLQHQRRLKNTPVNTRPFLSQFHYNMASTTTGMRKSSNAGSNTNNNNQDEVPWQCVIDPHCCDECLEFMNLHQPGMFHKDEEKITKADKVSLTVIGLAGLLAFSLLLTLSGPGSWRFFLAGGLCAASSHAIPTPIDVVKVSEQVFRNLKTILKTQNCEFVSSQKIMNEFSLF